MMIRRNGCVSLFALLLASSAVRAEPPPPGPKPAARTEPARAEPAKIDVPQDRRTLMRTYRALSEERNKLVRERGTIFERIAAGRDYTGEHVLFRDQDVTAFLDLSDPRHPRYAPRGGGEDEAAAAGKGRAHVLVVPNQPREHIGKTLTSDITREDLELALKVVRAGEAQARRLGIKNPQIFVKSAQRVGVGYLHVHVIGDRDPNTPYPPPLKGDSAAASATHGPATGR